MKEIRIHGRGGDGAVTLAHELAMAAGYGGRYGQSCQAMAALRRGAPVEGYARIDSEEIVERGLVVNPDYVILLSATLAGGVNIESGMKKGGRVLVNGIEPVDLKFDAAYIDATSLALKYTGSPVPNNVMLGAFAAWTGLVTLEEITRSAIEVMGPKVSKELIEKNQAAMTAAYQEMKERAA